MEITVNIKCPDLPLAAAALAKAVMHLCPSAITEKDIDHEAIKEAVDPAPKNPTLSPAMTTPTAAPTAPTAPAAVPTTPAPQMTGDMVAKAGADLIAANPAAMAQLNGLLQKYGVGCAQELRPDQIGPFATEMRALGAKV